MSRFLPGAEVVSEESRKLRTDASYDALGQLDTTDLATPSVRDSGELCDEVSALMLALDIEMGPTAVGDGKKIVGLWIQVPFIEEGVEHEETFALLRDRREVAFGVPPRAGRRLTHEQLSHNSGLTAKLRDAAYVKLLELAAESD